MENLYRLLQLLAYRCHNRRKNFHVRLIIDLRRGIVHKGHRMHGGLSPDLQSMEQIRRVMRPTDVPDTGRLLNKNLERYLTNQLLGLLCDLLWSDPDKDITGWSENDRGVSFTFGPDVVSRFLQKHDMDLICRAHQVVEDGYEFFAKRQLVTLFSAPYVFIFQVPYILSSLISLQ